MGWVGGVSQDVFSTIEICQPILLVLELGKEARVLNDKRKISPAKREGKKEKKEEGTETPFPQT